MAWITIEKEYDDNELMDAVFENLFSTTSPWFLETRYDVFSLDVIVPVTYVDENDEIAKREVTLDDIVAGLQHILTTGYIHCGADVSSDMDDWDACVSDMILQAAIFGKVIYG